MAQEIKGRLTDARDGSPLSNVNITVKGTNNGTTTNAEGRFTINSSTGATLLFSSIGFSEKEVTVI